MNRSKSHFWHWLVAVGIALVLFALSAYILSAQGVSGKVLTREQNLRYLFSFVVLYAVLAAISYLVLRKSNLKRALASIFIATTILGSAVAAAVVVFDTPATLRSSVSDIARGCAVIVSTENGHGSGFSIQPNQVVTNNHVIADAKNITVHFDKDYSATVVKTSKEKDIALLRIDNSNITQCSLADSDTVKSGQDLYIAGWPNDAFGEATITKGIFSKRIPPNESTARGITSTEIIQTDASINPGNSGGPVITEQGVVGMSVAKELSGADGTPIEGIGFVISSNAIKDFLK